MIEDIIGNADKVLVIGIGGGGDVIGSIPTYRLVITSGLEAILGAIPWERFVIDPNPGPISLEEFVNIERIGSSLAYANENSYAIRGDDRRVIVPQIVNVSKVLKVKGLIIDINRPISLICEELKKLCIDERVEAIFGIDVGGDVLAQGLEHGLKSPLADAYMLTILWKLHRELNIPVIIGILGPGVDGELPKHYVLSRISEAAARGGYLGAKGITKSDVELMEEVLKYAYSEASKIPIDAFKGFRGIKVLRGGVRKVNVDIDATITYYLNVDHVFSMNNLAQKIVTANSIIEASKILESNGVVTELHIEYELYRYYRTTGKYPSSTELLNIITNLEKRVKKRG
ncbi:MAG: hypothetical protein B6V02_00905 [Thermoprotei archaeon ex4572_64]|nr:MAG: hypothetical protein B6V02_00905 [Thermoprotei archaeon ex4572_64]